jgi:hypothetical protein
MSRQTKSSKPSRNILKHIKRAVNARDHHTCQSCDVHTEFIYYDHKFPFNLGGPTTVENIQSRVSNMPRGRSARSTSATSAALPNHAAASAAFFALAAATGAGASKLAQSAGLQGAGSGAAAGNA